MRDTDTRRVVFKRLETDAELLARIKASKTPGAYQWSGEPMDATAERCGLARKIVEDSK